MFCCLFQEFKEMVLFSSASFLFFSFLFFELFDSEQHHFFSLKNSNGSLLLVSRTALLLKNRSKKTRFWFCLFVSRMVCFKNKKKRNGAVLLLLVFLKQINNAVVNQVVSGDLLKARSCYSNKAFFTFFNGISNKAQALFHCLTSRQQLKAFL